MNIAQESPRFENDILYWYAGNTWSISFTFTIYDEEGTEITISPTDIIIINFRHNEYETCEPIKTYTFTDIVDNTVTIVMDETTTQLFPRGHYVFGIMYQTLDNNTIIPYNRIVVEAVA